MSTQERFDLISGVAEEVVSRDELWELLDKRPCITAYDGFEPSGAAHIGSGILRAINIEQLQKAGVDFKILIADWHAWINNKLGGDLEAIENAGNYFIAVWKAVGVKKVDVFWASDMVKEEGYWKKVVLVGKNTTLNRAQRAISIMGRRQGDMKDTAQLLYPLMQVADVFHLGVDMTQLGLDQRRAGMLAREVADKMKWRKPIVVSHHMLMGLSGKKQPEGKDEDAVLDSEISSKMSKSEPGSAIFVHDSKESIARKLDGAFCPAKVVKDNPVLEYNRHIVFRKMDGVKVERDNKFGGDVVYRTYAEMERDFESGNLHPADLKASTAENLNKIVAPVRKYFERNSKARELFEKLKETAMTK